MLTHLTSFLNHGELPVAALAYSKKQDLLLVCDGRYLRLYSSRDGYRCVRAVQLPPTVRRSRTPTTVVLLSRLLHSPSLSLSLSLSRPREAKRCEATRSTFVSLHSFCPN